jgi:hypothetical protein
MLMFSVLVKLRLKDAFIYMGSITQVLALLSAAS